MSARPRIWVSQPLFDDIVDRLREVADVQAETVVADHDSASIAQRLSECDGALLTLNERVGAAEIANAKSLKVVANVAVGYNNLDIAALHAQGVIATNTPDVLTETTADMAWALLMATARRVTEAERWLREGQWREWSFNQLLGVDVHGSTLAILGMGRIGQAIARRAQGFGMRVIYHNRRRLNSELEAECKARYVEFDELLQAADHLVLTLPFTASNYHLIDTAALARMKPTATLVNIARGGLIDERALAQALAANRLAGAGLDVFEGEPAVLPELLEQRRIVMTPHIGSASLATRRAMVSRAVDNLIAGLGFGPDAGNPPNLISTPPAG